MGKGNQVVASCNSELPMAGLLGKQPTGLPAQISQSWRLTKDTIQPGQPK